MTAGELAFIGKIAPDPAAGEDIAAQAQSVLSRLTVALAERGLNLEDLLRLRLFVGDLGDLPAIERAIDSSGSARWPAVSVLELSADSSELGAAVALDAVAAPGAGQRRRIVCLPDRDGQGAHAGLRGQPHSVRLGPWVFVGATAASAAGAPSSLPSARPGGTDSATRRIYEEARAAFAHIAQLLRAQAAELRDVVSVGGWLTFPMRDYGPLGDVREALLADAGLFPSSAAVQVGRVRSDGAPLAFEAIAFAPEDPVERGRWRAASLPPRSPLAPYYASARSAGGYVFTCGEVPTGTAAADRPAPVQAQAQEVYARLRSHLLAHRASAADVVHQTVFVRRPHDRDAVADAARVFYGSDALPPTTLLGAADIGFHPGCDVEIELVAAADGRPADAR